MAKMCCIDDSELIQNIPNFAEYLIDTTANEEQNMLNGMSKYCVFKNAL